MSGGEVTDAESFLQKFSKLLSPELAEVLGWAAAQPGTDQSPFLQIPRPADVDLPVEELADWVIRSSNAYSRIAHKAGIARAELKLADGAYKRALKRAQGNAKGTNDKARESEAWDVTASEHERYITAQAIVELIETMESAARLSSESVRKIYDKVQASNMGQSRQEAGERYR